MRNFLLVVYVLVLLGMLACEDRSNPFQEEHWTVKQAQVKATENVKPIPGIDEDAISITSVRNLVSFPFKEGVEYSYKINVRSYLPNMDFEADLVNAPEGMLLELVDEFGSETTMVNLLKEEGSAGGDPGDSVGEEGGASSSSGDRSGGNTLTNVFSSRPSLLQKEYAIRWKPSEKTIPDGVVREITRSIVFRVSVGEDKEISKEFRYTVTQSSGTLKITGYSMSPELTERTQSGQIKVYVKYPNDESKSFPSVYFEHIGSPAAGCDSIPHIFELMSRNFIADRSHYYAGSVEYIYRVNLTNIDISVPELICPVNVFVFENGVISEPYETEVKIFNIIKRPETNWIDPAKFKQGESTIFQFQVYGRQNEGDIKMAFDTPCSELMGGGVECACYAGEGWKSHIAYCTIRASHRKVIGAVEYDLEFRAQIVKETSKSEEIKFERKIIFTPQEDQSLFEDAFKDKTEKPPATNLQEYPSYYDDED